MITHCLSSVACSCPQPHGSNRLPFLAAELAVNLDHSLQRFVAASDEHLGHLEAEVLHQTQELQRRAVEAGAQAKAAATPPCCPVCRQQLTRLTHGHARTFRTRFGPVTLRRTRGYCRRCKKWRFPADAVLGLEESAGCSPAVQELAALLASKLPVSEAAAVLKHLTGVSLPETTLHRQARRQGERAQAVRARLDAQAAASPPHPELPLEPYQMIIEMDAWNIRERDDWGRSDALRRVGQAPERWHWVWTGTVFRLDHRGETAGGRPVISERGFVATRTGLDGLRTQLHAEALRRGLGQATGALIIGDGAVWLWRLADDRFPQARQRLDYWHAVQHLAVVGRARFGEDAEKLRAWLGPLKRQLKHDSAVKVIRQLEEVLASLNAASPAHETVAGEVAYLREHQDRMDYRAARRRKEPIGSGAVESTCRQYQCRFKRPGQFWSRAGDEALLCLDTFWRNDRWHLLFPHTRAAGLSKN
jgi:hypothetical protein